MKIGVVCAAERRLEALRNLLPEHHLVRISAAGACSGGGLADVDGVFVDVTAPGDAHSLAAALRPLADLLDGGEEDCPCVVRQDETGRVQLQCGRQAAAKLRAALAYPSPRTTTLIFQRADPGRRDEEDTRSAAAATCQT